jgi:AcrR family transcriptional regulator
MSSDLTARARIRDAAISLFAERGIDGATIRDIAQAADVSSGLLRHHFGSKEGLRDACDEYAMAEITGLGTRFTTLQRYLIRSTMDGSPAGNAMFDRMVEYGEHWLKTTNIKSSDPRAFVALLSVMKMSMFTMREQLGRALGTDVGKPEGWVRILRASLEIFANPLVTPELAAQAQAAIDHLLPEEQP